MEQIERTMPKYRENIIVAVIYKRHFEWYVAPKNLWKMDYRKLYSLWKTLYERSGKGRSALEREIGTYDSFIAKRWGIEVLDSESVSYFLAHLFKCRYSSDELRFCRSMARDDRKNDYDVSLYIDFDNKIMCSCFPPPENFENFVPDGWVGQYGDIIHFIPQDKRF